MPSASAKPENKAPPEGGEPMKQVLHTLEKKVKNLERRKVKLDHNRKTTQDVENLNREQRDVLSKYEEIVHHLDLLHELEKTFISFNEEAEKASKKQARKQKVETRKATMRQFQEVLHLQDLLNTLSSDSVRQDFLTGRNGAIQLDESRLDKLDQLHKLVTPDHDKNMSYGKQVHRASDHLLNLVEGRNKPVVGVSGTSYSDLKELVDSIRACRYFDESRTSQEDKEDVDDEKKDEGTEKVELSDNGDDLSTPAEPISLSQPTNQFNQLAAAANKVAALEAESSVSSQLPQSQMEPALVGMSQQAVVSDPNTGPIGTTSQNLGGLPAGFQDHDDSFFTTTPYTGQRAFTDIVSSVQGTFNFLQDSHIESSNSPHIDPAVVAAQPMTISSAGDFGASGLLTSGSDRTSQPQSQNVPQADTISQQQLESTYSSALDYGQQSQMSNLQNAHTTFGSEPSSGLGGAHQMTGLEQAVTGISSTPDVPPSIPLPNQTSMPDSQANISQDSQEKKHYPMNPNAVTFQSRSVYSQGSPGAEQGNDFSQPSTQEQHQQSHSSSGMDNKKYNDYQGSSSYDNSGYGHSNQGSGDYRNNYHRSRDGSRGGPRGGSGRGRGGGGSSGMSNGYNQRGGRSNGPFSGGRGGGYNGNSRGSSRGAFQGYPPRSDYQPEGGYQGYSNGYSSSSSSFGKRGGGGPSGGVGGGTSRGALRGGASGGGMRGGPRGGMRGGSGGRGGYGGQRSGSQQ